MPLRIVSGPASDGPGTTLQSEESRWNSDTKIRIGCAEERQMKDAQGYTRQHPRAALRHFIDEPQHDLARRRASSGTMRDPLEAATILAHAPFSRISPYHVISRCLTLQLQHSGPQSFRTRTAPIRRRCRAPQPLRNRAMLPQSGASPPAATPRGAALHDPWQRLRGAVSMTVRGSSAVGSRLHVDCPRTLDAARPRVAS
jgi:hypothetical protein